jgi:hypothetical protein
MARIGVDEMHGWPEKRTVWGLVKFHGLAERISLPPRMGSLGPIREDGGVVEEAGLAQKADQANPQGVTLNKFFSRGRNNLHEVKSLRRWHLQKKGMLEQISVCETDLNGRFFANQIHPHVHKSRDCRVASEGEDHRRLPWKRLQGDV